MTPERYKTILFVGGSLDGTTALVEASTDSYHVAQTSRGKHEPETYVRPFLTMSHDAPQVFAPSNSTPSQVMAALIIHYRNFRFINL